MRDNGDREGRGWCGVKYTKKEKRKGDGNGEACGIFSSVASLSTYLETKSIWRDGVAGDEGDAGGGGSGHARRHHTTPHMEGDACSSDALTHPILILLKVITIVQRFLKVTVP
jgi:hypothetical protein